jgi:hypothetical protein
VIERHGGNRRTRRDEEKVQEVIKELKTEYQMSVLGELKWFLGIHVLQDRSQRLL